MSCELMKLLIDVDPQDKTIEDIENVINQVVCVIENALGTLPYVTWNERSRVSWVSGHGKTIIFKVTYNCDGRLDMNEVVKYVFNQVTNYLEFQKMSGQVEFGVTSTNEVSAVEIPSSRTDDDAEEGLQPILGQWGLNSAGTEILNRINNSLVPRSATLLPPLLASADYMIEQLDAVMECDEERWHTKGIYIRRIDAGYVVACRGLSVTYRHGEPSGLWYIDPVAREKENEVCLGDVARILNIAKN